MLIVEPKCKMRQKINCITRIIPPVPEHFPVKEEFLSDITEFDFISAFHEFVKIIKQIYRDILFKIENEHVESKKKSYYDSGRKLDETIQTLGKIGYIDNNALIVDISALKSAKTAKYADIFDLLISGYGFGVSNWHNRRFEKNAVVSVITYPDNAALMHIWKVYAENGTYFDYRKLSDRDKLPPDYAIQDFARIVGGARGKLALELHNKIVSECDFRTKHTRNTDAISYHRGDHVWDGRLKINLNESHLDNDFNVEISLINCSEYMHLVYDATECIKQKFRDRAEQECRCCKANPSSCGYAAVYEFEGESHRKCHFLRFRPATAADIKHLSILFAAESEVHRRPKAKNRIKN
jgi:hypothetical protein